MTGETFERSVTDMVQTLYRVTCSKRPIEAERENSIQETLKKA